jgi:hypothetical protein
VLGEEGLEGHGMLSRFLLQGYAENDAKSSPFLWTDCPIYAILSQ